MKPEFIEAVFEAGKQHARDRYLSALLCPPPQRDGLVSLAAVIGEIERIPAIVSDPMLGEIRLQWWADWLANLGQNPETKTGNPIADAFTETRTTHALPIEPLQTLCEARISDFYADAFETHEAYHAYLSACEAGPYRLAAIICGHDESRASTHASAAVEAAGRVTGGIRVLMKLAFFTARGRWPLPLQNATNEGLPAISETDAKSRDLRASAVRDEMRHIERAAADVASAIRAANPDERPPLRSALRPVALTQSYLKLLKSEACWSLEPVQDMAPFSRVWGLGMAKLRARP
ncbi:MAG: squalene/phytoene synthase family protein [Pseudomonadota bacterium]